jgi:putative transposase
VVETLTGSQPSASTVSRVFHSLEEEYSHWKMRKLEKRYAYAFADGTYFTVIYNGQGCKMPILAVVGISQSGEREEIGQWVSDGNQAMLNAITKKFHASARQRCIMHKMDNVRETHSQQTAGTEQIRVASAVLPEGPGRR